MAGDSDYTIECSKDHILQDNYELVLILKQRRWRCTNPECYYDISDTFKFVNKRRRTTNATDMLIVYAYRNLMEASASIAARFHVSDSYVHEVFDRYKEQKIYFHQWLEKLICKSLSPKFFQHSFFLFCKIKSTVQKCKLLIIIFYKRHKNLTP